MTTSHFFIIGIFYNKTQIQARFLLKRTYSLLIPGGIQKLFLERQKASSAALKGVLEFLLCLLPDFLFDGIFCVFFNGVLYIFGVFISPELFFLFFSFLCISF